MEIEGKLKTHHQSFAEKFNTYYISVADNIANNKDLSTDAASSNRIDSILHAFNDNLTVGGIFCDLTNAFDSVNHSFLLSKLEYYGITDHAFRLIKSYLVDRYQRVLIKDPHSTIFLLGIKLS